MGIRIGTKGEGRVRWRRLFENISLPRAPTRDNVGEFEGFIDAAGLNMAALKETSQGGCRCHCRLDRHCGFIRHNIRQWL